MKKGKHIGFHIPDDDEMPEPVGSNTQLTEIIKQLYKPNGYSELKDFKTSLELVYELSDMMEVTTNQVSEVMNELGFEITTIDNQVCFIVFIPDN